MDMYLPALPQVADALSASASASASQATITTFFVGLCLGHLVVGPLSDVWGRRRPLVLGYSVYVLATAACAWAPTILALASARLVQGFAVSAGVVLSRAIVRDMWTGPKVARMLSRLSLAIGSTAALAPLVGAALLAATTWRGIFAFQVLLGILLLVAIIGLLPETHGRTLRQDAGMRPLLGAFRRLLASRSFTGNATILALSSGAAFAIISGGSFVVQEVYGQSPAVFGLVFGGGAAAIVGLSLVNIRLLRRRGPGQMLRIGLVVNLASGAMILVAVLAGAGLVVAAIFMVMVFGSWGGLIVPNATARAMADHPASAGSASALLGIIQYGSGALVAPLVGIAGSDTALPFALLIAACSTAALLWYTRLGGRRQAVAAEG